MKERVHNLESQVVESSSISNYTIAQFVFKLFYNQPSRASSLGAMFVTNRTQFNKELGQELVEVLKELEPNVRAIINKLFKNNEAANVDDMYEIIQPVLDKLFSKNLNKYGVNFKDLELDTKVFNESMLKNTLLPVFFTLRDIPKICKSVKDKNLLKVIQDLHEVMLKRVEADLDGEIRKHLIVGDDGLYEIKPNDSALVSQVKKCLNIFTYAERVISFIYSLDLNPDTGFKLEALLEQKGDQQVEFLTKVVWYIAMKDSFVGGLLDFSLDLEPHELEFIHKVEKIISYVRIAQSSLLELDLPIYHIFGKELKILDGVFSSLQKLTSGKIQEFWGNKSKIESEDFSRLVENLANLGGDYVAQPLGSFIDELNPRSKLENLRAFTNVLGTIPGKLDQLTQFIYSHAGQTEQQLALGNKENEAYKNAALKLFFELSDFNELSLGQQGWSLAFPVRENLVTLGLGAFEQLLRTNESIEQLVSFQLAQAKNIFTQAIEEADKLELYFGASKGVWAKPTILKLNEYYQYLVEYASNVVDLKTKYPDLLQLDNTSILTKRLQNILGEKNACQLKLERVTQAKKNVIQFAREFSPNATPEQKIELNKLYQSFKPFVIEYEPSLSVLIDIVLTQESSNLTFFKNKLNEMAKGSEQLHSEHNQNQLKLINDFMTKSKKELDSSQLLLMQGFIDQSKQQLKLIEQSKPQSSEENKKKLEEIEAVISRFKEQLQALEGFVNQAKKELSLINAFMRDPGAQLRPMGQYVLRFCEKEYNTYSEYIKLATLHLATLPKQVRGKLYALDFEKQHSCLLINEPEKVLEQALKKNQTQKEHLYVSELSSLTLEQKAHLYDYYSIRLLSLEHIQQEIEAFLLQIADNEWSSEPKKITAILARYRVLQPYWVDFTAQVNNYQDVDAAFVGILNHLLDKQEKPNNFKEVIDKLAVKMKELNENINQGSEQSTSRRLLFSPAHQEINEKKLYFTDKPLTLESELVLRQNKWIRHQQYSRTANDLQKMFIELFEKQLDPCLNFSVPKNQSQLVTPFPEMEDDLAALEVSSQISWAKRMLNVLHYIESNFAYLESLDRDIKEKAVTHYFLNGPLVEGMHQLNPFIELTKSYQTFMELLEEPMGQIFWGNISASFEQRIQDWGKIRSLYFIGSNEVQLETKKSNEKEPRSVKSNGLWYSLVAALVLPEHLRQLSGEQSEVQAAQQEAKELVLSIEEVIDEFQAGHYFNLFLDSPSVWSTFVKLKTYKEKLCKETNRITLENLKEFQAYLYEFLQEADAVEIKYGLKVGLISKPTKLILDKLFSRFIEPLSISFEQRTTLAKNTQSYEQRIKANYEARGQLQKLNETEQDSSAVIEHFLDVLKNINEQLEQNKPIDSNQKKEFKALYERVYFVLQAQQSNYQMSLNQKDKSIKLDGFCAECHADSSLAKNEHCPLLVDMMYLTTHIHAAKKGHINRLENQLTHLGKQTDILTKEKLNLQKDAQVVLNECIKQVIDKQINEICKKAKPLVWLDQEYKSLLFNTLSAQKETLFKKVSGLSADKIERVISEQVQQQFDEFSNTQYKELRHLDSIVQEIRRFQGYCNKESKHLLYENNITLPGKITLLKELEDLAFNTQKKEEFSSIGARVTAITSRAKTPDFATILEAHDNSFKCEPKTLKRLFFNLFHSIFNFFGMTYHPKDFYSSLSKAIEPKVAKNGFFSRSKKLKADDSPNHATKLEDTIAPPKQSISPGRT